MHPKEQIDNPNSTGTPATRDTARDMAKEARVPKAAAAASGDIEKDLQALRDDLGRLAEQVRDIVTGKGRRRARQTGELGSSDEVPLAPAMRANPQVVEELARQGYSEDEVAELVVPKRTLARRRAANELLTIEETDKALRLKRIAAQAERVFGDSAKARRWLRKPKRSLRDETPLAYLASENGARMVEDMLGRIEHGIYA